MITIVSGEIVEREEDSLTVMVGGVGLSVFVPQSLREAHPVGEKIILHTHLIVREDLLALYGFSTKQDRDFFRLLLGVNGVGPRLALNILSSLSVDAIRRAVFSEQADIFARVPGIGKKNAQKVLLHLQGKVGSGDGLEEISRLADADAEVLDALVSLGYSVVEAQSAIQSIPKNGPEDVEERLRIALQRFVH